MPTPKRPKDPNQLAKSIVDIALGLVEEKKPDLNPRGRAGGLKGGKARAKSLTPAKRSEIAKKAAKKRWG